MSCLSKNKQAQQMSKYFLFFVVFLHSSGCSSKTQSRLSEGPIHEPSLPIPSPKEFASADLNKDNVIDLNEYAIFLEAQGSPDYVTPLVVISAIVALIVLCCSISSVGFFFKSKYYQLKHSIFKK